MARLDTERQARLEPERIKFCREQIENFGLEIISINSSRIDFIFENETVMFYPYSGWHTGKSIVDGRGWNNLKKQLTKQN